MQCFEVFAPFLISFVLHVCQDNPCEHKVQLSLSGDFIYFGGGWFQTYLAPSKKAISPTPNNWLYHPQQQQLQSSVCSSEQ